MEQPTQAVAVVHLMMAAEQAVQVVQAVVVTVALIAIALKQQTELMA
jgi:hypothetical protein